MKKLTKEQLKERDGHIDALSEGFAELERAISAFNTAQDAAWEAVDVALGEYNEAVTAANAFQSDVAASIEDYVSERSEKWQEGDRADAYDSWKTAWEEEFEEATVEQPTKLEMPEDYSEELGMRPEEVEG
jgi:hypothetical protein